MVCFQVLHSDGQWSAIARFKVFWINLPGQQWYVYIEMRLGIEIDNIDTSMWDFQVPVIAVFTKYDQFKRNVRMKLQDDGCDPDGMDLNTAVEDKFKQHYLAGLNGSPPFIRLESEYHGAVNWWTRAVLICPAEMHKHEQQIGGLIDMTANALGGGAAALMLMAVQRGNLERSVKEAINW